MKRRLVAEPWLNVRRFVVGLATFWYQMTSLPTSLVAGGLALLAWVFAGVGLRRAYVEKRQAWIVLLPVLYLNLLLALLLAPGAVFGADHALPAVTRRVRYRRNSSSAGRPQCLTRRFHATCARWSSMWTERSTGCARSVVPWRCGSCARICTARSLA